MYLKLYGIIGVSLLELIVRNIARYPQSATSTPIRYQPAIRYLVPCWSHVFSPEVYSVKISKYFSLDHAGLLLIK
jgi:hypothetical protein